MAASLLAITVQCAVPIGQWLACHLQGDDDFITNDEANEVPPDTDMYRPREAPRGPARDQDITAEQLNEYVQSRFGDRGGGDDGGEDFDEGAGAVQQQALLPTNADPKLWLVSIDRLSLKHPSSGRHRFQAVACATPTCLWLFWQSAWAVSTKSPC